MPARVTTVIALAAVASAAFVLGRATSTAPAAPPQPLAPVASPAVRVVAAGGSVTHLDDADLHRIRDEVVAAMASHPVEQPQPPAPEPPSPEQASAGAAGNQVIDDALANGQWTDAQAAALRAQLGAMSLEDRVAAARRIAVAVNAGRLRVRVTGPLL